MTRGRLTTLQPRVTTLDTRRALAPEGDARIRGRALQRIRDRQYRTQPFCVRCLSMGVHRTYTVIDHIVPLGLGGKELPANRRPLCDPCHDIVTAEQFGMVPAPDTGGGRDQR